MRTVLVLVVVIGGVAGLPAPAQDAALRDRVAQLVGRLESGKGEDRDRAETSLRELGVKILPLLPPADRVKDADARQRLERVRGALAADEERLRFAASKVTIQGKGIRLTEALKLLQQQSNNIVTDLREQEGGEVTNPQLDLDLRDKTFFEALDAICAGAGLSPYFYTGDGTIGLMAAGMPGMPAPGRNPLVTYSGPFRIAFRQLVASRDFETGMATANAQFLIAWEPRLRPMLLSLKSEDVTIRDDKDQAVEPAVPEESESVVIRPETPVVEINLNMAAPERTAQKLSSLKVKAELTLPAGLRTFRFADLGKTTEQEQGDVKVKLSAVDVEEQVWKFRVLLTYAGGGPAFESYQQGLFNNRLWLQGADGSRLDHDGTHGGGFESLGSDGMGRVAFEYLFVDVPGKPANYSFVYETPSRVERIPLEFEFKDILLP